MGVDDLFENKKKIFTIAKIQESTEFPLNQKYKGLKITFAEPINYYDGYYREEAKGLIMQYKLLREKGWVDLLQEGKKYQIIYESGQDFKLWVSGTDENKESWLSPQTKKFELKQLS